MFDIGWSELLVIVIVAIVVVGPKELPRLMRTFGHYAGKLRRAASDFQHQFEAAMAESEADSVRKNIENIREGLDKPVMLPKKEGASPPAAMGPPSMVAAPVAAPPPKRAPAKATAKKKPAAKRRKAKS
ncbi:MAG: twin-arginine translocase subunit TatB [Alphaproteobacteria bacterium]|nr:twin-arginine translocase subunit TatB [Alphaproteobacteria bacterium]